MDESQPDATIFSVRIVSIDYYMASPIPGFDIAYSSFQGGKVTEVPVIRIYGSTPGGQKACVHVHGALPYLYIPISDMPLQGSVEGDAYKNSICLALEKALKLQRSGGSKRQRVHGCDLVRAKRLYGYHLQEELFLKIYLYYPQDVSCAANLLLGGAVLEKSFQPHESHISYILQFLVDYNLYGMGHMHLASMKFRLPVPHNLSSGKAETVSPNCFAATSDYQIWRESTIPNGWIWQYPCESGISLDHSPFKVKRQSICQLEADTLVDDIINQQFKMYTSFSQAEADLKMVQSLIPMWQEEYERTGLHEGEIQPDPGKPHPRMVLKTFSSNLDYEQKLLELFNRFEGALPAFNDEDVIISSKDQKENVDGSTLNSFPLSGGSTFRKSEDATAFLLSDDRAKVKAEEFEMKSVGGEDLALLKWFASSQATQSANSEDELFQEMFLSPLMPAATINKVMEKANSDYQDESQKECQDILDSIECFTDFEGLKQKNSSTEDENSYQNLPNPKIPQVDGAGDDEPSAFVANCSDKEMDVELIRSHVQLLQDATADSKSSYPRLPNERIQQVDGTGDDKPSTLACSSINEEMDVEVTGSHGRLLQGMASGSKNKQKRKRPLWVSLPFKVPQSKNLDGSFQSTGDAMKRRSPLHEIAESKASVMDGNEQNSSCDPASGSACYGLSTHTHSSPLNECSVRDLMRKKRAYRFEQYEFTGKESQSVCSDKEEDFIPRKLEFHTSDTTQSEDEVEYIGDSVTKNVNHKCSRPVVSENSDTAVFASSVQSDGSCGRAKSMVTSPTLIPASGNVEMKKQMEYISMSFYKKPPLADQIDLHSENASLPIIPKCSSPHANGYEISVEEGNQDGFLPFFYEFCKEDVDAPMSNTEKLSLELAMGVPLHYQNDGSYLYLLTPAFTAPPVETVCSWLSSRNAGSEALAGNYASPLKPVLHNSNQVNVITTRDGEHSMENDMLLALQDKRSILKENVNGKFSEDNSQISGSSAKLKSTPLSQIGFRDPANLGAGQQIILFSIEVHAESRGHLRPHPQFDAINIVSIAIQHDSSPKHDVHLLLRGVNKSHGRDVDGVSNIEFKFFSEERDLLDYFVKITCLFDPDILIGWDVQGSSLGFLAERALHLGIKLLNKISRIPVGENFTNLDSEAQEDEHEDIVSSGSVIPDADLIEDPVIEDEWGRTHASGLHVGGRIILNVWRLMRGELKLNMYTIEAVAEAVLRRKVPCIHWTVLNKWFSSGPGRARYRCIHYMAERAKLNIEIINQLDMINRTSELARVFGIDFFSVLSRGSQYRVESMLLRLAHMQNYVAISPSYQQVASQPAMECLPLVMEPESGFYADPVVVLDFQSLYPSMIIAYNLCFSTCLGKVVPSKADTLGVSTYAPDPQIIKDLNKETLLSPNGVMYVPTEIRKGVLPRLLEEILSTRIMIKKAMKKFHPSQKILQRIYNARQLALKLIANVTYGYTAAGFSGRMPCAELADSIVQCGRRTLETAISFVNTHNRWNAKVVYGDTDSMFVLLKGRTWKEAFVIGQEIAAEITAMNPNPVTLKMEKVYQPCFLLTKKRYVGYSYESLDQAEPVFDAKGIETVRRDTCAAVSKMMEKSLRTYFEQQDISKVKEYVNRQWSRILSGRISLQDFIFAKEVRLGSYSERTSSLPPGAIVAMKAMRADPRTEPRYGERVPYVVVHGEPGARLVDLVVHPQELLAVDSPYRLNDLYYIKKQIIPALQRVFGLVGADLNRWFSEMPRPIRDAPNKLSGSLNSHRTRIDYYYYSKHCVVCGELMQVGSHLCGNCLQKEGASASLVIQRTSKLERDIQHLAAICGQCGGGDWLLGSGVKCTSLACSVFYERRKVQKELQALSSVASGAKLYPQCNVEWF